VPITWKNNKKKWLIEFTNDLHTIKGFDQAVTVMKIPESEIRVQVDRWPIMPKPKKGVWPHFLSVIVCGSYTDQPSPAEIREALQEAINQLDRL
jgi:hypothetical protein